MRIFVTATDTDVGKTYVSKGITAELIKRGKKTGYFKPFQSGIVENVPSDAGFVIERANNEKNRDLLITKNSYVTKTPSTPSVSAKIDNVGIDIKKVISDFKELSKECKNVVVEGSGGLHVPVNDNMLMSDVIKSLNLPTIVVARPDLGTINHTLLTIEALKARGIKIPGVVISNYPKGSNDPVITTAPSLIEHFSGVKILNIIYKNQTDFKPLVDNILKNL